MSEDHRHADPGRAGARDRVRVHTRAALTWRTDVPSGARYWAATLRQAQMTWFEVPPHGSFGRHSHPSDQITLVLEGMLCFAMDDGELSVGPGEAIAIPGGVPHAVRAGPSGAKAVDSWGPPMAGYEDGAP